MPSSIHFPCSVEFDNMIFIFGYNYTNEVNSYLLNISEDEWTYIGQTIPCGPSNIEVKITCAYIRPKKFIIVSMKNCILGLDMNVFPPVWIVLEPPRDHSGFVFNSDDHEENVMFIGNNQII